MKVKRVLCIVMCLIMVLSVTPMTAFANGQTPETTSISFQMGVSIANGTTAPNNYGVEYQVVDAQGNKVDGKDFSGISENGSPKTVSLTLNSNYRVIIKVTSASLGIRLNGDDVTDEGWLAGKTLSLDDLNGRNYSFELFQIVDNPNPGEGGENQGSGEQDSRGKISFTCQGNKITGGSIYYKRNSTGDFIKVSEENGQYNSLDLAETDTALTIKFEAKDGYKLDTTRGVILRVDGNEKFNSTNINDFISVAGHTFNLSDLIGEGSTLTESSFELEFGFENAGGGPSTEPGPVDEPAHGGYEGEQKTASVTVDGQVDFYINDSQMVNSTGGTSEVTYTYEGNSQVDFYFCCFINQRYTTLKVNDVDYYANLPDPSTEEGKVALLAACKGQINEFKITVPYSESGYEIESNVKWLDDTDKDYMVVGNFLWTYEDENQGDDYIDHGRMELLGVNYNSTDYLPDDLNNPGTAFDWGQDEHGGSAVLPVGSVITVKLVPDYGYQLTSFGINGGDFGTGEEQSTFTFEIKPGNAHLGAHFTPVADRVTSSSDTVTSGRIQLGLNEIDTGSVVLSVDDAKDEDIEKFEAETANNEAIRDYEIASVLDINLNQVLYKGTENDVWTNEMSQLNKPAEITLALDDNYNDPVVIHEKHDGSYEVIATTYDTKNGTITFETNSFSNYAIASKHEHSFNWVITKLPTKDTEGIMTGTCDCKETATQTIPKLQDGNDAGKIEVESPDTNSFEAVLINLDTVKGKIPLTLDEVNALNNGNKLTITLKLEDKGITAVPTRDQQAIKNNLAGKTLGTFLDISLLKQIGNLSEEEVKNTVGEITIRFTVPESLRNTDSSKTRTYKIMRNHNGVIDVLDATYNNGELTFKTDKFSAYALVYTDVPVITSSGSGSSGSSSAIASYVDSDIMVSAELSVSDDVISEGKQELRTLVGNSYSSYRLALAVDLHAELTRGARIKILVDDITTKDAAIILHKGVNGWEVIPTEVGNGCVIGYFTSLSPVLVFVDRNGALEAAQAAVPVQTILATGTKPVATGDNANTFAYIALVIVAGAALTGMYIKRKNNR